MKRFPRWVLYALALTLSIVFLYPRLANKQSGFQDGSEHRPPVVPRVGDSTIPAVPEGENRIVIDKSQNRLYLFQGGRLVRSYRVATGKELHFTPEGTFKIANKVRDSRSDSLEPRLGNRWMGLAVPNEQDRRGPPNDKRAPLGRKYGIHGTNEPESIGEHASAGCVRMDDRDIVELFDRVEVGTSVEIRP